MEKQQRGKSMNSRGNRPIIVVITGAESTGKSALSQALSQHFHGSYFPEYAREYLENKGHGYTYQDVEEIAAVQFSQMKQAIELETPVVFFDTWLIITRVWFEVVYGHMPAWIDQAIREAPVDLYLLCANDIPWIPDPLRENGGENRVMLYNRYLSCILEYGFKYHVISGTGQERQENAVRHLVNFLR